MNNRTTIILLILVVLAGITAWHLSSGPSPEQQKRRRDKLLPGLDVNQVQQLDLDTQDGSFLCRRSAEDPTVWRMKQPIQYYADSQAIDDLLSDLAEASRQTAPVTSQNGDDTDLAAFGLDPPRAKISCDADDNAPPTLYVGNTTGIGDLVYVAVGESRTVQTTKQKHLQRLLELDREGLLWGGLLPEIRPDRLTEVSILNNDSAASTSRVTCHKNDHGWELRTPVRDLADPEVLGDLLDKLMGNAGDREHFLSLDPEDHAQFGLDQPDLVVETVTDSGSFSVRLAEYTKDGTTRYCAAVPGLDPVIHVEDDTYRILARSTRNNAENLRDRRLARFDPERASVIRLTGSDTPDIVLEKTDDGWGFGDEDGNKVDKQAVDALLDGLVRTRAERFIDDEPERRKNDTVDVRVYAGSGTTLGSITATIPSGDGQTCFRRPGYDVTLTAETASWMRDLRRGRLALLDRTVLDEPADRAERIEIQDGETTWVAELSDVSEEWRLRRPVRGPADGPAIEKLLENLSPLRSRGVAAEQPQTSSDDRGLEDPHFNLTVHYGRAEDDDDKKDSGDAAPEEKYRAGLRVGEAREQFPSGRYAVARRNEDAGRMHVLDEKVLSGLRHNLASREVAGSEGITELRIATDDGALELYRESTEDQWHTAGGSDTGPELRRSLQKLTELLADFRSREVVALTRRHRGDYGLGSPAVTVTYTDEAAAGKKVELGDRTGEKGRYVTGPATGYIGVAEEEDVKIIEEAAEEMETE